jgi:CDP-6-deoxy-D-xylo-4-hexulose-3-dehydrase
MTTGEGGAIATNNDQLAKIVCSLRDWGRATCSGEDAPGHDEGEGPAETALEGAGFEYDPRYIYNHLGYNVRMSDLHAALGIAQLPKLNGFIKTRQRNFEKLCRGLEKYENALLLPAKNADTEPAWQAFPIMVREGAGFSRHELITHLQAQKIETRPLWAGNIVRQPAFKASLYRVAGGLEGADLIMRQAFVIGLHPNIKTTHLKYMLSAFDSFFKNRG